VREFSVAPVATTGHTTTLTDPVWDNADRTPDAVQLVRPDGGRWREVTCAQLREAVVAVARWLIAAGIGPGDRVGSMSRTRYEWTVIDYAVWACGAVTVPIYETSSAEQVAWILGDSGAVGCVVETAAHGATVDDVRPQLSALERLWQLDGPAGAVAELVGAGSDVPADEVAGRPPEVTAADLREDPDLRARCRKRLTRLTSPCRGPRRSGRFGSFPRFQRGHRVVDPVAQDQAEPVRKEYADEIAAIYAG
jgi:long-chain acyl-CoA synthetase